MLFSILALVIWGINLIRNKKDYLYYLNADMTALKINSEENMGRYATTLPWQVTSYFFDDCWHFERLLRKVEYYLNCRKSCIDKIVYQYLRKKLHDKQLKLGFFIHPNTCGAGLALVHPGTVIINQTAKIGENCRIYNCVIIGIKPNDKIAPAIGNNVYIGPGAKIFGEITIADDIAIGANSVVNKSFYEPNITIAGNPARKVSDKGSSGMLVRATELIKKR